MNYPSLRSPTAADLPQRSLRAGRLLGTALLIPFLVLVLALSSPGLASAHALGSAQPVQQRPNAYQPDPCLVISFWSDWAKDGPNTAVFHFGITNSCGFPVKGISATYSLLQLYCDPGIGTGNKNGSFSVPNLGTGGYETTELSWNSYCIECSNGNIVGYPSFIIDVTINQVRGFDVNSPTQLAIMSNKAPPEDSTILLNDANNPGPLHC